MKARVIGKEVNAVYDSYTYIGAIEAGGTNKSNDKVWILTYTEIAGHSVSPNSPYDTAIKNSGNDGEEYAYFAQGIDKRSSTGNSGLIRGTYSKFWLTTGHYDGNAGNACAFIVNADGSLGINAVDSTLGVVPAVRVS